MCSSDLIANSGAATASQLHRRLSSRFKAAADSVTPSTNSVQLTPATSRVGESDPTLAYYLECRREEYYAAEVSIMLTNVGEALNNAFDNQVPDAFAERLQAMRQHGRDCIGEFDKLRARPVADDCATEHDVSEARRHVALAENHAMACSQDVFDLVNAYREESGHDRAGPASTRGGDDALDLDRIERDLAIVQSDAFLAWLKQPNHPLVEPLSAPTRQPEAHEDTTCCDVFLRGMEWTRTQLQQWRTEASNWSINPFAPAVPLREKDPVRYHAQQQKIFALASDVTRLDAEAKSCLDAVYRHYQPLPKRQPPTMSMSSPSRARQRELRMHEIVLNTELDHFAANENAINTTRLATRASKQWMTIEQSEQDIDEVRATLEKTQTIVAAIKNRLNRAGVVLNEVAPPDDPRDEHKSGAA